MGTYAIRMPDVGEGIAEAELVEWQVKPGDIVREDDVIAAVMTDKATVEIPTAVSGKVIWLAGDIGDRIAVGAELIHLDVEGEGNYTGPLKSGSGEPTTKIGNQENGAADAPRKAPEVETPPAPSPDPVKQTRTATVENERKQSFSPARVVATRPVASPSVRKRALDTGIDLRLVPGSGPAGRITHDDLTDYSGDADIATAAAGPHRKTAVEDIKVVGLRRKIAERMAAANSHIPHITIVEEVDVTALEDLRRLLNGDHAVVRGKLTMLPFIMRAIVRAVAEQPGLNAHFLDDENIIRQFEPVHIGIATQTPNGLMVPVVRHAEAMGLWDAATEIARLAEAARKGAATRQELSGSTISISSLGALGALATTPIINRPEVAIVGINKIARRPIWIEGAFEPRQMMNISCSFDHRVIDGWDAAVFVQKLKVLLEGPAVMFVEG
ncbi:dihydrolipoamide acetyltransferase family protein [Martelella soudanensis]|uniref:dihydrolipoamide acetyltransferase family protein n=1 Tax=unclassified Martelella TaxID=2629616 RepID=UPI0015DFF0C6|nr:MULTISPECIES: dihydrolipoamide acetyltransferase family protein [unclassified Martelella]